ncbi:serine/threonine-protein kinase PknA [Halovivax asiaticus JCM 14624]|uniref:Serine/threonine-protein kinase PknA n=1 Tax=Halovivax asiaticus JCM 14624 TaxID=1227490 RepID=M0BBB1_9EURY|nr:FHA domain-containing serine/threonine-protein kinase [Halovivax asiaticus]ELZ07772.1 serine/threonine-protein kinase PknA [Halovivax asiaticus JCM 14624]
MSSDPTGSVVADRYRLEARLDSGGLSTVWRATELDRDRPVALKRADDAIHDREQVRRHFDRELRWVRRFAEAPIPGSLVRFLDGSTTDEGGFVVTELIDGGSLADRLPTGRSGTDPVRSLAAPICRAIAFLHENGVVHLDVKPSNVLLRPQGTPVVIDLNSAAAIEEGTSTVFHHDPFKPPELSPTDVRDDPAGPWSDVYALGVLIWAVLTGDTAADDTAANDPAVGDDATANTPVAGDDSSRIADWTPFDPWAHGVDCSADLATVIRTATEPRPADRYDDATELLSALEPILGLPDQRATLTDEASGVSVSVRSGDAIGRTDADRASPAVVLPDVERYLSPTHATIEWTPGGWRYVDRSVNGTYVDIDGEWRYVCAADGIERRRAAGESVPDRSPPEHVSLEHGTRFSPVSPEYSPTLTFGADR